MRSRGARTLVTRPRATSRDLVPKLHLGTHMLTKLHFVKQHHSLPPCKSPQFPPSCPSSSLGTRLSSKLCFVEPASSSACTMETQTVQTKIPPLDFSSIFFLPFLRPAATTAIHEPSIPHRAKPIPRKAPAPCRGKRCLCRGRRCLPQSLYWQPLRNPPGITSRS